MTVKNMEYIPMCKNYFKPTIKDNIILSKCFKCKNVLDVPYGLKVICSKLSDNYYKLCASCAIDNLDFFRKEVIKLEKILHDNGWFEDT